MKRYLTLDEMLVQANECAFKLYKWALVNDEFRFVHVIYAETHLMLVEDGDEATDAGTICVAGDAWSLPSMAYGSIKLKVGCSGEAMNKLEAALAAAGRERRER